MPGKVTKKVDGGKLFRVEVDHDDRIRTVKLTGDFFIQPPQAREQLEEALEGLDADTDIDTMATRLADVEADLIGVTRHAIAEAVAEVIQ